MRITEFFKRDRPVVSFEFFPPRTDGGFTKLFETIAELKRLDPAFVSVTWGAGGSTRAKTIEIVSRIQREVGLTAMAHLTCVGLPREEIAEILDRLQSEGIENVLPLRGDPPKDAVDFVAPAGGFGYANELTAFIRTRWDLCLGGACYPETHTDAPNADVDLANLVRKVKSGSDFLVTQLFFDNAKYFAFVERARGAGIEIPIVPGIMPVVSAKNVRRMASLSGASIPEELQRELDAAGEDAEATLAVGVEWATLQCRELLARGAPGIHFYTLNQSPATRRIFENLFG